MSEFHFGKVRSWNPCPYCERRGYRDLLELQDGRFPEHFIGDERCNWSGKQPPPPKPSGLVVTDIDVKSGTITVGRKR